VKAKVLLISNLPEVLFSPDYLFNVLSFYGDVERIKVMKRKVNCALVQFTTATFAAITRDYLDGQEVEGCKLAVTFSRHNQVLLPNEPGYNVDGETKDFSSAEYTKRYQTEQLKKMHMKKITKPSNILYLCGIKEKKSPNQIKALVEECGVRVSDCIGLNLASGKKGPDAQLNKMYAYLQVESVDKSICAMAFLNYKNGMKLSFVSDSMESLKKSFADRKTEIMTGDLIL